MFDRILIHSILSHYVAQNVIHSGDYDQLIESKALHRDFPFQPVFVYQSIDTRTPDVIPFSLFFISQFPVRSPQFSFSLFFFFNSHYPCPHTYAHSIACSQTKFLLPYSSIRSVFKYQLLPLYLSFK